MSIRMKLKMKRFSQIIRNQVRNTWNPCATLVGWDGCEVRLCAPCARISPGVFLPHGILWNPSLATLLCGALVKMAEPLSSAAHLTSELAALRARQAALLPVLRHRNQTDQSLIDNVDAVFARVPEYIAKLAEVQHSMDMLAARTANMRRKCENLVSSDL
jgi:hypothetical protein